MKNFVAIHESDNSPCNHRVLVVRRHPTPKAAKLRRRLWEILDDESLDGAELRRRINELLKEE